MSKSGWQYERAHILIPHELSLKQSSVSWLKVGKKLQIS